MDKRGVSTIVSKVVIYCLIIIGVAFIMVIAFTIIQKGSKQIDLDQITLNLEITKAYALNDSFVEVWVKRNPGEGKLVGLAFVFFDGKDSEIIKKESKLEELYQENYVLELKNSSVNDIEEISVASLIKARNGEIITCNIDDMIKI